MNAELLTGVALAEERERTQAFAQIVLDSLTNKGAGKVYPDLSPLAGSGAVLALAPCLIPGVRDYMVIGIASQNYEELTTTVDATQAADLIAQLQSFIDAAPDLAKLNSRDGSFTS